MVGLQKVLVTGATGYIGAHVVSLLLQRGYFVRTAVRNQKRADMIASVFSSYKDRLEFAFIDLSKPDSFNSVLQGINGVFHIAAPLPGSLKASVKEDYLDPAIEGNLGLLRAVANTPSVKRVVITSSIASIVGASSDPNHQYTEKDWNPITYEAAQAIEGPTADYAAYIASKKLGEKAAFDFMEKEKRHFDIATILPGFVFGPDVGVIETTGDLSSLRYVYGYITTKTEIEPSLAFHYEVDVREVALAHVLAYENPKASNQRYIVTAEPFAYQDIVETARKEFAGKTQAPELSGIPPLPNYMKIDNSKSRNELGIQYRKKSETLHDSIASLLALKQQGKLQH